MKIAEIRKLDTQKLVKDVDEIRIEIAELRRSISTGETSNVRMLRNKRKQLARMLTVMGEQFAKEDV
jgi:ribosomal protein L29